MSEELIRQLKSLKHASVKPDEKWLKKNRELLLSQIRNTVSEEDQVVRFNIENFWQGLSVFLPRSIVYSVLRPATALILILSMGVGSWVATVSASYEALPGEWLYPAKRVAEKTQVAVVTVVGDKNELVKLHGEIAKKRAVEISKIVQDKPDRIVEAKKTVNELKDEIKIVSIKLEEIKAAPGSSSEAAKDVNQNAAEIKVVLEGVKDSLLVVNDTESAGELSNQVSEAKNLIKDTAVKAVEVMVEKHLQGDTSVSKEELKKAISDQLESGVIDAAQSKQSVIEVNNVVSVVKTETAIAVKDVVNKTTNVEQVVVEKIEQTSKQTQEAVSSAQALTVEAGKTASEGQTLLSQDNLVSAVDKLKEVNATTNQVEKISDTAIKAVQTILPVAATVVDPVASVLVLSTSTSSTVPSLVVTNTTSTPAQLSGSTTPLIIIKSTTTPPTTTKK